MTKKEFMNQLKDGLKGNVSYDKYTETVAYYEDYFEKKVSGGMSEEQVAAELGSGRLIAKTIVDTEGSFGGFAHDYKEEKKSAKKEKKSKKKSKDKEDRPKGFNMKLDQDGKVHVCYGRLDFSSVLGKIVLALIVLLLISLVALLVYVGIQLLLYIIVPVAIILFIIHLIISFMNK